MKELEKIKEKIRELEKPSKKNVIFLIVLCALFDVPSYYYLKAPLIDLLAGSIAFLLIMIFIVYPYMRRSGVVASEEVLDIRGEQIQEQLERFREGKPLREDLIQPVPRIGRIMILVTAVIVGFLLALGLAYIEKILLGLPLWTRQLTAITLMIALPLAIRTYMKRRAWLPFS